VYRNFLAATMLVLGLVIIVPALAQADDGEPGVVYAMTNADDGNEIVVYNRAANGTLTLAGTFPTGGSGRTTEPGDALGAQHPLILSPGHRWLFAVNAGSNEISVFKAGGVGLTLVDVVPSGGYFPASLTIYQDWLYVLNAGGEGNITGFTLDPSGHLTPLPGSTRSLQAGGMNPPEFLESPAEVGFSPLGDWLVVTVKGPHEPEPMHQIHLFAVDSNGLPSEHPITSTF
jgi:6-phosphogluconolactonase